MQSELTKDEVSFGIILPRSGAATARRMIGSLLRSFTSRRPPCSIKFVFPSLFVLSDALSRSDDANYPKG